MHVYCPGCNTPISVDVQIHTIPTPRKADLVELEYYQNSKKGICWGKVYSENKQHIILITSVSPKGLQKTKIMKKSIISYRQFIGGEPKLWKNSILKKEG